MPKKNNREKKSPIRTPPRRQAGESLHERLVDKGLEAGMWMGAAIGSATVAVAMWWHSAAGTTFYPFFGVPIAAVFLACFFIRARNLPEFSRRMKLGIAGERSVGSSLQELRIDGYHVLHDIVEPGFNIDHVLIGPGGVFAIETKAVSKPAKGNPQIRCRDGRIEIEGVATTEQPIRQARGAAWRIHEILKSSTMRSVYVQPVLL